jgi:hypothetical protein
MQAQIVQRLAVSKMWSHQKGRRIRALERVGFLGISLFAATESITLLNLIQPRPS